MKEKLQNQLVELQECEQKGEGSPPSFLQDVSSFESEDNLQENAGPTSTTSNLGPGTPYTLQIPGLPSTLQKYVPRYMSMVQSLKNNPILAQNTQPLQNPPGDPKRETPKDPNVFTSTTSVPSTTQTTGTGITAGSTGVEPKTSGENIATGIL